jgi:hypothetical protein
MVRFVSLFLFTAVLSACGDSTPVPDQSANSDDEFIISEVAESLPADQQAFFNKRMPDVMSACPGLVDHLSELVFVEVALGDFRPSIVWHVPDAGTTIPAHWMAGGNNCAFEYDATQDAVTVAKEGCQNLCVGKADAAGGTEALTIAIKR